MKKPIAYAVRGNYQPEIIEITSFDRVGYYGRTRESAYFKGRKTSGTPAGLAGIFNTDKEARDAVPHLVDLLAKHHLVIEAARKVLAEAQRARHEDIDALMKKLGSIKL